VRVMLAKPSKLSSDEYTLADPQHNELGPVFFASLSVKLISPSKRLTVSNPHHA
jgi:hypothetical protein